MKKIIYIFLFVFTTYNASAQAPKYSWARQMKGSSNGTGFGSSIVTDSTGNVYTAGYFTDSADFDPGAGNTLFITNGAEDIFISKLNAAGKFVWAKHIGGGSTDAIISMCIDGKGNIFATGVFADTVDFDPGSGVTNLISNGDFDAFILKLDSSGNFKWVKQMGSAGSDLGFSLTLDNKGNVLSTGIFMDAVDFDPGANTKILYAQGYNDIYISKLDGSGNFVWAKQFSGTQGSNYGAGYGVSTDVKGNVYTTGYFTDSFDFDPGTGQSYAVTSFGDEDVFVSKLNSAGNFIWAKILYGTSDEEGRAIAIDGNSNVITTGQFQSKVDFNPGAAVASLTSAGVDDIFISKLDSNGNYVWAKKVGGNSYDYGLSLALNNSNNIYTSGSFENTVDFDPGATTSNLTAIGIDDGYILKLNASGIYQWAVQSGGKNTTSQTSAINVQNNTNIYATGNFDFKSDFDPGSDTAFLTPSGYQEIYIQKLQQCAPTSSTITASACKTYTLNSQTYSKTGTYTQKVTNNGGCDSNITLKLTIKSTASVINASACKDYTLNSQTYSTTGTYNQTIPNAAGCDSVITLNLVIKNTTSTVNLASCNSLTYHGQTYNSSGTFIQVIPNAAGCDSTVTLHLSIGSAKTSSTMNPVACDSFVQNKQVFKSSGTFTQIIPNYGGCDSTITINLTVNKTTSNSITKTACRTYIHNSQLYTKTGTYTQRLTGSHGCDSLLTINLTVTKPDTRVSQTGPNLTATATGVNYQWLDCNNSKAIIPGKTAQVYVATINGSYAVKITDNGCSDTSACYVVTGVSVKDIAAESLVKVYPNPASSNVELQWNTTVNPTTLKVTNSLGMVVAELHDLSQNTATLDIHTWSSGMYLVEIRGAKTTVFARFIKE